MDTISICPMSGRKVRYVTRRRWYRIILTIIFVGTVIFTGIYYVYSINKGIPDSLKVYVGDDSRFDFSVPIEAGIEADTETLNIDNSSKMDNGEIHFSFIRPFTVSSSATGRYKMNLKLFGMFSLKSISLDVIDNESVIPCGNNIGIQIRTDGLLVLGTQTIKGVDNMDYEPAYQIVRTGDYITEINGKKVVSIEQFSRCLQKCDEKKVTLGIRRGGSVSKVKIDAVECSDGSIKIGVWVREDTQGIGTLTYVGENDTFAALGHGIADMDTGTLMQIKSGKLYNTEIINIVKGTDGTPGEIMGMILSSDSQLIGKVKKNTSLGISGKVNKSFVNKISENKAYPVALRQDIKKGAATILCQLGEQVEEYGVNIEEIDRGSTDNKSMVIKITDERLLSKTGGIIQGMSGAPILQNGRIVGAVTHVLVNDPTKGYGIFIENMLEAAG